MVSPSYSSTILGLPSVVKFSGSQEFWVDFQLCEELGDGGLVPLIPVLLGIDRIYERLGTCRKKMYVNSPTKFISHQKKICIKFPSVSNLLICLVTQIPFRKSFFFFNVIMMTIQFSLFQLLSHV